MTENLEQRIEAVAEQGKALLAALQEKVSSFNLPGEPLVIPGFGEAEFTLEEDKYNGKQTLMASFFPRPRYRAGVLLFHSDGSSFAEYLIMQAHPAKPQWFIESVEAWGNIGDIRTDARLIQFPS